MTEKEFIQAKHRLEEAEARNRVKERKTRTRRLIQEGAILEKAFLRRSTWIWIRWKRRCGAGSGTSGWRKPSRRAHLLTTSSE